MEDGSNTAPLLDTVKALMSLEDVQMVAFFFLIHFDLLGDDFLGAALRISSGTGSGSTVGKLP